MSPFNPRARRPGRAGLARMSALAILVALAGSERAPAQESAPMSVRPDLSRFASLALECAEREYPNKIAHVLLSDDDVAPPRELTPAFYGCFDWHSSVHGHWLLARLTRLEPDAPYAAEARRVLGRHLTPERMAAEVAYLRVPDRASFERPYGLAWLLQLAAELDEWELAHEAGWRSAIRPLERAAVARVTEWLPKLAYPIRTGEHSQTAFAFGLMIDYARIVGDEAFETVLVERTRAFYAGDRACPLAYEPSGQDFVSPCLAEADLMRRVLEPAAFAAWLGAFLPEIPLDGSSDWLPLARITDRVDGKLAHLDGLHLSRAWMLDGLAAGLPRDDPRVASIHAARRAHADAGLEAVTGEHYAGGHWLGSFAAYLTTRRGLDRPGSQDAE